MSRQSRNSKRTSTPSFQPSKQCKLSPPSSPCSETSIPESKYSIGMQPVGFEDLKTLFHFLLDLMVAFEKNSDPNNQELKNGWVNTIRTAIDAGNFNSLSCFQQLLKNSLSLHDSTYKYLIEFSDYLITMMSTRNPTLSNLLDILSPLLEARDSSHPDSPLLCRSILDPLCPTEHGDFYARAQRPGLSLNAVRERAHCAGYQEMWTMLLDLIILLEDTRSYYFREGNSMHSNITSLIEILHQSILTSFQPSIPPSEIDPLPLLSHTTSSPGPADNFKNVVHRQLSGSQKSNHYSIINQIYQCITADDDKKVESYRSHFQHVPAKDSSPDYYSRIKKPLDLSLIAERIQSCHYLHYNGFVSDLQLMCYNATVFYASSHPTHLLSLSLMRDVMRKLDALLPERGDTYPDPKRWLRDTISELFGGVKQYKDETGRELGLLIYGIKWRSRQTNSESIALSTIEELVLAGRYSRFEAFQKDLLLVFRRVQCTFPPSSSEYKAMLKLQCAYFQRREKLCVPLTSSCLKVTMFDFEAEMNGFSPSKTQRQEWVITQRSDNTSDLNPDQEDIDRSVVVDEPWIQRQTDGYESHDECDEVSRRILRSFTRQGVQYKPSDYVYIASRAATSQPHIVLIENVWQTPAGECWLFGLWFYRPEETFHLATKKFFEKEVFKTDDFHMCRSSRVLGKCYVMHIRSYSKFMPRGYSEEDVYVCQAKYNIKTRTEKKIKTWPVGDSCESELLPRDSPLQLQRVPSVFAMGAGPGGEGVTEVEEGGGEESEEGDTEVTNIPCQHLPNGAVKGFAYFDQCQIDGLRFKLGDFVYVQVHNGGKYIVRIDQMWNAKNNDPFFAGPWILNPSQTQHPPTQLFYKKEVIMSTTIDTNPMRSIIGKCSVMPLKDYCDSRPIEQLERDVYVCVYRYYETGDKELKKIKTFKSFTLASQVQRDEYYKFDNEIIPERYLSPNIEDYISGKRKFTPLSLVPMLSSIQNIPVRKILPTHGYGMFCSFNRSKLQKQNPNLTVPQLTKMLAAEWRSLTPEEKTRYEKMASERNLQIEKLKNSPGAMVIYECSWGDCDYQFENVQDLFNHAKNKILEQGVCKWRGCHKSATEFLSAAKLLKHVKEAHVRTSSKLILPNQKSKNFIRSSNITSTNAFPSSSQPSPYSSLYPGAPYGPSLTSTSHKPPLGTQTVLEALYSSLDYATNTLSIPCRTADSSLATHELGNEDVYARYIASLQYPCTQPINDLSAVEALHEEVSSDHNPDPVSDSVSLEDIFDSRLLGYSAQIGDGLALLQSLREYMDHLTYSPSSK